MGILDGRVALVTGANHGIGAATAVALARLGADVAVTYLSFDPTEDDPGRPTEYGVARRGDASAVVDAVEGVGRRCLAIECDLSDASAIPGLLDEVAREVGGIDVLVHNASSWRKDTFSGDDTDWIGRSLAGVSVDSVDAQFAVDARAGALLIAEFASRHRARSATWGRIVTLTSGGPAGFPGEVSYGAAKAALENYTMSASIELASQGITANVVYPPVTDTGWITDAVRAFVASSTDHHHVAAPDEVAEVIAWVCTPAADLLTGNVLRLR